MSMRTNKSKRFILWGGIPIILITVFLFLFVGPFQPKKLRANINDQIHLYHDDVQLIVIGFNDRGKIESLKGRNATLSVIEQREPRIIIFFVHGWKNDGSIKNLEDGNLSSFQRFLVSTSDMFKRYPRQPFAKLKQYKILGIYLAWHGHSRNYLQDFTFWDRLAVSSRVGKGTEFVDTIKMITKKARQVASEKGFKARIALAGHSMGGKLINELLNGISVSIKEGSYNQNMPDMILVINPAAPIDYYTRFMEQYHRDKGETDSRSHIYSKPMIISVASEADMVTRFLYTIGTGETAIGQGVKVTHRLKKLEANSPKIIPSDICTHPKNAFAYNLICHEHPGDYVIKISDSLYYELEKIEDNTDTPYWILRLPEIVLKDHSSFFDDSFLAMVGALFKYSRH